MRSRARLPIELQSWVQTKPEMLALRRSRLFTPINRLLQLVRDHLLAAERAQAVARAYRADQRKRNGSP